MRVPDSSRVALLVRVALAVALTALAAATASLLAPALAPAATPAALPAPGGLSPVCTAIGPVSVHRGEQARLVFRVDQEFVAFARVSLVVTDLEGDVRRRPLEDRWVPTGRERAWTGDLRLPVGRYRFFVTARDALGRPQRVSFPASLEVLPPLPPLVPEAAAVRAATAWADARGGRVAYAVVDSRGALHGFNMTQHFPSASVVKAMLLVQYLRTHTTIDAAMRSHLTRMIEYSDNAATDVVYGVVGRTGLLKLAAAAGMRYFQPQGGWITTHIAAADMARFFRDMERYIPARHRAFARQLLSGVVSWQRWGIPPAAEPRGYRVYFKGGWLGANVLANQAARLEKGEVRLGLCVLTTDNPTSRYGPETIQGVTERLLR